MENSAALLGTPSWMAGSFSWNMLTAPLSMPKSAHTDNHSAFRARHGNRGAIFHTYQDGLAVQSYGSAADPAGLEKAVLLELPDTGLLEVEGRDAERLLHLLFTQDIASIPVGGSRWSSVLDRHGRLQQDLQIWRKEQNLFLLLTPPGQSGFLANHIRFHQVTEDVEVRNLSPDFTRCVIVGERISPILGIAHHEAPITKHDIDHAELLSAPGTPLGLPTRDLLMPTASANETIQELNRRGVSLVGTDFFDGLRIAQGIPLWKVDADSEHFPNESGFTATMDTSKGCYLGSEIVSRIFQLGPRTQLMGVELHGDIPPPPGTQLVITDGPVVNLSSAAWCPQRQFFGGLVIVPTDFAKGGLKVSPLGQPDDLIGTLSSLPFPPGS